MAMSTERRIAVAKDLLLTIGGMAGIFHQQWTGHADPVLTIIFALAAGVPGITNVIALFRPPSMDTALPSSSPVSQLPRTESESRSPASQDSAA